MMKALLSLLLLAALTLWAPAAAPEDRSEEHQIGTMVLAIQAALKAPQDPKSLETIAKHGTDSRYYVMIRGWLVQVKSGVESQLAATKDPGLKAKHQQRVTFLKKALRRIDLE
jgi:hypothetical protein